MHLEAQRGSRDPLANIFSSNLQSAKELVPSGPGRQIVTGDERATSNNPPKASGRRREVGAGTGSKVPGVSLNVVPTAPRERQKGDRAEIGCQDGEIDSAHTRTTSPSFCPRREPAHVNHGLCHLLPGRPLSGPVTFVSLYFFKHRRKKNNNNSHELKWQNVCHKPGTNLSAFPVSTHPQTLLEESIGQAGV